MTKVATFVTLGAEHIIAVCIVDGAPAPTIAIGVLAIVAAALTIILRG